MLQKILMVLTKSDADNNNLTIFFLKYEIWTHVYV